MSRVGNLSGKIRHHQTVPTSWSLISPFIQLLVVPENSFVAITGNDVARCILQFAKAKPLGENGLDWLKIHLVNLTGLRKRESNRERLQFANEMMPQILDSADNPLSVNVHPAFICKENILIFLLTDVEHSWTRCFQGNKWWLQSDEPWQTLAACKEVANAVRSPDPREYQCRFPVHQVSLMRILF